MSVPFLHGPPDPDLPQPLADDRAAAERMVEYTYDRIGASEAYRSARRERDIRQHMPWCAFERRNAQAKACQSVGRIARLLAGHRGEA